MSVLINFKMCDNSNECDGIAVCPTGALSWDDKKKSIVIDNSKCISCGQCEKVCPIGAISVAKTEEEYEKFKKEIDDDPRTIEDLFVDRYGASPISSFSLIKPEGLKEQIKNKNIVLIEVYNDDSIECLAKSIPIKDIKKSLEKDTWYFKMYSNKEVEEEYGITEFPSLLIFRNSKLLGKVKGYYSLDDKDKLINEIKKIAKTPTILASILQVFKKKLL